MKDIFIGDHIRWWPKEGNSKSGRIVASILKVANPMKNSASEWSYKIITCSGEEVVIKTSDMISYTNYGPKLKRQVMKKTVNVWFNGKFPS